MLRYGEDTGCPWDDCNPARPDDLGGETGGVEGVVSCFPLRRDETLRTAGATGSLRPPDAYPLADFDDDFEDDDELDDDFDDDDDEEDDDEDDFEDEFRLSGRIPRLGR